MTVRTVVLDVVLWVRLTIAIAAALVSKVVAAIRGRRAAVVPPGSTAQPVRVAVIGGGIAGVSAAWALQELGASLPEGAPAIEVHLFEERPVLGGNAKTHLWAPLGNKDDDAAVRTGLSVLGWPAAYFKNYEVLLERLGIAREAVRPKFAVSTDGETLTWAHGEANGRWSADMQKWDRGVAAIRAVNDWFGRTLPAFAERLMGAWSPLGVPPPSDAPPSFYEVSMLSPMNLIPAKFVMCTVFGVSQEFWQTVVVAVYSSSFLTGILNDVPAVIIPALDDIISVGTSDPVKSLNTWTENSSVVFAALAERIGSRNITVGANIDGFEVVHGNDGRSRQRVVLRGGAIREFDFTVFACPASSVDKLTAQTRPVRTMLFNTVIGSIRYETERDRNFVHGDIHTDRDVLPAAIQKTYFSKRFSNYVRVLDRQRGLCCNVFTLGTWIPPALAHAEALLRSKSQNSVGQLTMETTHSGGALDLYVSYDAYNNSNLSVRPDDGRPQVRPRPQYVAGEVDNSFAHPVLSPKAMALAASLALLQGQHGVFYCGSYATPGNGHDLSHLSGLAAAAAVVEATMGAVGDRTASSTAAGDKMKYYAHAGHASPHAARDFIDLRRLMGL